MSMNARMKVDIILGTVAGVAQILSEIEEFQNFYFQGLEELAINILFLWPANKFKNQKQALRYIKRVETKLEEIQNQLDGKWKDLGQVLNFLLAEVVKLHDDIKRRKSKNAKKLEPLIEMLEQYIETIKADKDQYIESGLAVAKIFEKHLDSNANL